MAQVYKWLEDCISTHPQCRPYLPVPYTELRMLDLSSPSGSDMPWVRLVEGVQLTARFAALSHCWGMGKHLTTTKSSLVEHKKSIPMPSLPKTFRDAVAVCRFLRIDYLWIDSLCIIQDDARDWEEESQKMGSVYQYAHLVISADAAADSSVGCFTRRDICTSVQSDPDDGPNQAICLSARRAIQHAQYTDAFADHEYRDPLSYRAWVLQEWLLGRRVLHFTGREIVWDCKVSFECECGGFERLASTPDTERDCSANSMRGLRGEMARFLQRPRCQNTTTLARVGLWLDVVEEFTMRQLTKPSDRMIAISGLASEIGSSDPSLGGYFCGFFRYRLVEQLLWTRYAIDERPQRRFGPTIAPSWSWGSINQPVSWDKRSWLDDSASEEEVKVVASVSVDTGNGDQFGQVVTGLLTITAPSICAILPKEANLTYGQCTLRFKGGPVQGKEDIYFPIDVDLSEELDKGDLEVLCFKMLEIRSKSDEGLICGSLILIRSPVNVGYLQRIGADNNEIPAEWYNEAETRIVVVQ
jgi:hypothetical protein